jgi:hypothetical protein
MPAAAAEEVIALALVFVVHLVGGLMLVFALLDDEQRAGWRRRWGRGRGGDGPPRPQPPTPPDARGPRDERPPALPLPVTAPSDVRLREPARVADGYPRPARRPEHEPQPQRAPVPARHRQRRD